MPEGAEIRTYCEETEYEMLSKIKLRYKFCTFIDKFRQSFIYKDCEISIYKVKNLGDYIEIEYKGTNSNIEEVIAFLNYILKEISAEVGPADHKGYAYNILKKMKG